MMTLCGSAGGGSAATAGLTGSGGGAVAVHKLMSENSWVSKDAPAEEVFRFFFFLGFIEGEEVIEFLSTGS